MSLRRRVLLLLVLGIAFGSQSGCFWLRCVPHHHHHCHADRHHHQVDTVAVVGRDRHCRRR